MLRNLSIRSKLLVLLAAPLTLLVVLTGTLSGQVVTRAAGERQLSAFAAAGTDISALLATLRDERLASVQHLAAGDPESQTALTAARAGVDAAFTTVFDELDGSAVFDDSEATEAAWQQVTTMRESGLGTLRGQVDNGATTPLAALNGYAAFGSAFESLTTAVADSADDRDLAGLLAGYGYLLSTAEALSQEQAAGWLVLVDPANDQAAVVRAAAAGQQAYFEGQARARLGSEGSALLDAALNTSTGTQNAAFVSQDRNLFATSSLSSLTPPTWLEQSEAYVGVYQGASQEIGQLVGEKADASAAAAVRTIVVVLLGALLVLAAVLLLGLHLARSIGNRLRDLAVAATEVRDELPRMVERMQSPGEGPGVEFTPIPVTSNDEIGQLKVVINDLNETTFRIAGEQAALRASIAEMFVNVARRDQTLLARQLAFLDQLERTEENPDTLEDLFTLDHLATRMRRNAESLLVLAGINTGRRLRRPLPLSDVVRTAAGEIEHYDRVDLALQVDPPVVGHLALSASHLIAELLENATNFSDPGTRVVVGTAETDRGVEVSIKDTGLGMNGEEVETAHQRISGGRASEFVGAQRLGFYVVGRLAGRLDVEIEFDTAEGKGTTVTLVLPAALFTPGSVKGAEPELAALDSGLPALGDGSAPSALPDAFSALPDAAPSALPEAGAGGLPTRQRGDAPTGGASTIVSNPLAASGLGDALSETLQRSAAEAAASSDVGVTAPKSKVEGRQLPTRQRSAQAQAKVEAAPVPAPVAPLAQPAAEPAEDWKPVTVPAAGTAAMPKRERKEQAPTSLAAAQDILPKAGKKPRQVRDSVTPPKTAAEAFWTSRKKGAEAELKGSALDALEANRATTETPGTTPAPAVPVVPEAPVPVAPVVEAPVVQAPVVEASVQTPVVEVPVVETPVVEAPVAPAPVVQAPVETPVPEVPVVQAPPAPAPIGLAPETPETPAVPAPIGLAPEAPETTGAPAPVESAAPTRTVGEALRQRSALAATALNALTEGQNFTPSRGSGSAPLVRRQAGATAAAVAAKPAPARTAANRQRRAPADVRSMLSGFQAGVSRGRSGDTPAAPESETDGDA